MKNKVKIEPNIKKIKIPDEKEETYKFSLLNFVEEEKEVIMDCDEKER